jgi:hypothetical protein
MMGRRIAARAGTCRVALSRRRNAEAQAWEVLVVLFVVPAFYITYLWFRQR